MCLAIWMTTCVVSYLLQGVPSLLSSHRRPISSLALRQSTQLPTKLRQTRESPLACAPHGISTAMFRQSSSDVQNCCDVRSWMCTAGWASICTQTRAAAVVEAPPQERQAYQAPKSIHGFELVRDQFVAEYDSQVLTYRHKKTGERHAPTGTVSQRQHRHGSNLCVTAELELTACRPSRGDGDVCRIGGMAHAHGRMRAQENAFWRLQVHRSCRW